MADVALSSVAGGGNNFRTDGITVQSLSGTGVLYNQPAVQGKVFRIFLLCTQTASEQSGISLIIDGQTIESEGNLVNGSGVVNLSTGDFGVWRNFTNGQATSSLYTGYTRMYDVIECESFSIEKNTGGVANAINLSYETGELI